MRKHWVREDPQFYEISELDWTRESDVEFRRSVPDDPLDDFFDDVPADVFDAVMAQPEPRQADAPFAQPLAIDRWPDVPTRVIAGADDRFFPTDFQIRVSQDRLGITPDVVPGGHLVALSRPVELADRLLEYLE